MQAKQAQARHVVESAHLLSGVLQHSCDAIHAMQYTYSLKLHVIPEQGTATSNCRHVPLPPPMVLLAWQFVLLTQEALTLDGVLGKQTCRQRGCGQHELNCKGAQCEQCASTSKPKLKHPQVPHSC
jgi:hypothetical protein